MTHELKYSMGSTQETGLCIELPPELAQAMGSNLDRNAHNMPRVSMAYDPSDRMVYMCPGDGPRLGVPSGTAGGWRIQKKSPGDWPVSASIMVDATLTGDIIMFQLPEALPKPRVIHRGPKATPQGIVEAFQAAMAAYPAVKLKVLAPGVGLVTINPNMIKVTE